MLLVGKLVNYAAKGGVANTALTPSDLDNGSIGIYGMQAGEYRDKLIVSGATATGVIGDNDFKGTSIKICEGLGGGLFKTSAMTDVKGIQKLLTSGYVAPTPWTAYIGYNGTSGAVLINSVSPTETRPQTELLVKIREGHSNQEFDRPKYFDVLIDTTGETQLTILNKIKAALDDGRGNPPMFTTTISSSGGNSGLKLVALDVWKTYVINIEGRIENSPITVNGETLGSGSYRLLRKFEIDSQAKRGDLYTSDREFKSIPTSLIDGTTYDVYKMDAINYLIPGGAGGAGLAGNPTVGTSVTTMLAFPSAGVTTAGGNQIEVETILQQLSGITITSLVEAP